MSIDPPNYASIGFINELKSSRTYTTRPHTNEIEDVRRVGVMPKWASVEVVLCKHVKIVLHWYITLITVPGIHFSSAPQTEKGICITFEQRRPNVEDVGPTLYKCSANGMCFLGSVPLSTLSLSPTGLILG